MLLSQISVSVVIFWEKSSVFGYTGFYGIIRGLPGSFQSTLIASATVISNSFPSSKYAPFINLNSSLHSAVSFIIK